MCVWVCVCVELSFQEYTVQTEWFNFYVCLMFINHMHSLIYLHHKSAYNSVHPGYWLCPRDDSSMEACSHLACPPAGFYNNSWAMSSESRTCQHLSPPLTYFPSFSLTHWPCLQVALNHIADVFNRLGLQRRFQAQGKSYHSHAMGNSLQDDSTSSCRLPEHTQN